MVADRAGTSGSCQALLMMMRVASPVGRRIGDAGGQMQHAGFEQVGFHFVPVDIGQHVPVDLDTRRKALPALFEYLSVVERIVDDIPIFRRADCDFPKMARTPLLQPQFGSKYAVIFCFGFLVEVGRNLSVSSFR